MARGIAQLFVDDATASIRFWALATDDDKDACTDPQLRLAALDTLRHSTAPRQITDAQHAAAGCFAALEADLNDDPVRQHPYPQFAKTACPVLKTHGAQTIAKKKQCP